MATGFSERVPNVFHMSLYYCCSVDNTLHGGNIILQADSNGNRKRLPTFSFVSYVTFGIHGTGACNQLHSHHHMHETYVVPFFGGAEGGGGGRGG